MLSEECGAVGRSSRRWILDPIDGTFNFVAGRPGWGTHIALECDGELAQSRISVWAQPNPLTERVRQRALWVEPDIDNILGLIEGHVEAVVDAIGEPWDHAPRVALVTEAGGTFRDPEGGRRLDMRLGIYGNGHIDDQLDRVVAGGA